MKQRIKRFKQAFGKITFRENFTAACIRFWLNLDLVAVAVGIIIGIVAEPALAQNALPNVSSAICNFAKTITGPIAGGIAVIVTAISGLMLAVGEVGGVFKTFLGIAVGVGVSVGAAALVTTVFPGITGCP
jgi:type IV secretory pathway VirB2 component (pilin)